MHGIGESLPVLGRKRNGTSAGFSWRRRNIYRREFYGRFVITRVRKLTFGLGSGFYRIFHAVQLLHGDVERVALIVQDRVLFLYRILAKKKRLSDISSAKFYLGVLSKN